MLSDEVVELTFFIAQSTTILIENVAHPSIVNKLCFVLCKLFCALLLRDFRNYRIRDPMQGIVCE